MLSCPPGSGYPFGIMLQRATPTRTLNVLVATPAGGTGQGGIDRVMGALKAELARSGNAAVNASFAATRGTGHIALAPFYLAGFMLKMLGLRLRGRLDLVHLNVASSGSTYRKLQIARLARLLGIPYVLHLHGAEYREFWKDDESRLSRSIKQMFEGAAATMVLGQVWRDFVAARAPGAAERIVIVPNATARPSLEHVGGGDKVHILFLGRIGDRKGVPQLGDALKRMQQLDTWRATIGGDGHVDAARTKAAELGLADRVDLPGWVGPERVAELIATADIMVLPSFAENLPMSVIEAMASGLAVVATPVGAVPDIIRDGETGLLVPVGDVEALAAALTRLVEDAPLRQRLGTAALALHRERLDLAPYADTVTKVWAGAAR
ncbi:MAG TPA: glycosyltransferase family 4 protein [Devosia sp.]|uniref:glycosyltransferase family 4 protein n=1 Tax=Devosia sp. TaxID=1871048 RepID=UPI002DDD814D|nr:glycosyltransferase family 4 protein [Devosia sp.]HEV2518031.1 glycosyltransferase family 4 protein [Devosia sp.]